MDGEIVDVAGRSENCQNFGATGPSRSSDSGDTEVPGSSKSSGDTEVPGTSKNRGSGGTPVGDIGPTGDERDNGSLDNCIIEKTLKVYYSNFLRLVASFGSRLARTNVSTFLNMCDNNFPNWRSHVDANSQWIWTILQELKENQANRSSSVMHNEMENRYMEELARICWRIQELSGQLRVRREKNDEEAFRRAELKARNEFYVDIVARVVEICCNAV